MSYYTITILKNKRHFRTEAVADHEAATDFIRRAMLQLHGVPRVARSERFKARNGKELIRVVNPTIRNVEFVVERHSDIITKAEA